jgi:hypothetical protein
MGGRQIDGAFTARRTIVRCRGDTTSPLARNYRPRRIPHCGAEIDFVIAGGIALQAVGRAGQLTCLATWPAAAQALKFQIDECLGQSIIGGWQTQVELKAVCVAVVCGG